MMKTFIKIIYGFFGSFFLLLGTTIVLFKTHFLPDYLQDEVFLAAQKNASSLHLLQEFGCLMIFAGILFFWNIRRFEASKGFHWAMTVFWALMSIIHWADVRNSPGSMTGPIVNTIPFILFFATGLLRKENSLHY